MVMTMMEMTVKIIPVKLMILDILELPRYIPVHGQKQYCDMIRKLSGADNKDEQVEFPPSLPPIPHPKNYNNHHHHNNNVDFPTHLAIRAVLTIKCKNIFAKVPDYLEATIYDKENAVIMVKPGQLILFGFE